MILARRLNETVVIFLYQITFNWLDAHFISQCKIRFLHVCQILALMDLVTLVPNIESNVELK
jgi:hypothetical protein